MRQSKNSFYFPIIFIFYIFELTIIIIAHRLSTLRKCEAIYRLQQGQIINTASYEQIIKEAA